MLLVDASRISIAADATSAWAQSSAGDRGVAGQVGGVARRIQLQTFRDGFERRRSRGRVVHRLGELSIEDGGGQLGHRLTFPSSKRSLQLIGLTGFHGPGGQELACALWPSQGVHLERCRVKEDLVRPRRRQHRVAERRINGRGARFYASRQTPSSATRLATTRGDTWSTGPSSTTIPIAFDLTAIRAEAVLVFGAGIIGGPARKASFTARMLSSGKSCSAASRAICIACSNRSKVRSGRLDRGDAAPLVLGPAVLTRAGASFDIGRPLCAWPVPALELPAGSRFEAGP